MLIDTHCHLDFPAFDADRREVISRAKANSINKIINIGSSIENSKRSIELSGEYDFIWATIGVHPHEAGSFLEEDYKTLKSLAISKKIVAIGETGLDYYKNYSKPENQKKLFISMLDLAKELGLPVVIHTRQAQDDTLNILKKYSSLKAVIHCFSGDENFLNECLGRGFFVSFTCNITYKKADDLRRLVKIAPLERMFLETDAPFLPPQEFRGRRNEPIYLKFLVDKIAEIKNILPEEVSRITTINAEGFFKLS